jgi:hypothetical protein
VSTRLFAAAARPGTGTGPLFLVLFLFVLPSAPGCRSDAGEKAAPPPIEECTRYEAAYLACGHKLGPVGERILAAHAEQMRVALVAAPDAPERSVAETRRACEEATRRITEACR